MRGRSSFVRYDKNGRRSGRCAESGAGMGASAGVGLTRADGCERKRREGARGVAAEIAWRVLALLAMAVCVTGGVFLLTVVFVALS